MPNVAGPKSSPSAKASANAGPALAGKPAVARAAGAGSGGGKPPVRSRQRSDFSVQYVLQALSVYNLVTTDQMREVRTKEAPVRSRLAKERGGEGRRYDVSPVEIIADFNFPVPGRPDLFLDQDKISEICALQCGARYKKIAPLNLDMGLITRTLSRPYASKHAVLPLERTDGVLKVAVGNPFDDELFDGLRTIVGQPIEPALSSKADILRAIDHVYGF